MEAIIGECANEPYHWCWRASNTLQGHARIKKITHDECIQLTVLCSHVYGIFCEKLSLGHMGGPWWATSIRGRSGNLGKHRSAYRISRIPYDLSYHEYSHLFIFDSVSLALWFYTYSKRQKNEFDTETTNENFRSSHEYFHLTSVLNICVFLSYSER